MKYQLFCLGRLLEGVDEAQSIAQIQRITKLSEEKVRKSLLNGRAKKLTSATDEAKLNKLYKALLRAGLEVEIRSVVEPEPTQEPTQEPIQEQARPQGQVRDVDPPPAENTAPKVEPAPLPPTSSTKEGGWKRWAGISLLLLLIAVGAAAGFAWHWLHRPLPDKVVAAENALFDGGLVIAGLVDVEKFSTLERFWYGELDPKALPMNEEQRGLLGELFFGAPKLRDNLKQALFSINAQPEGKGGHSVMLLAGQFDAQSLLGALGGVYQTQELSANRWKLVKQEKPDPKALCEKDEPQRHKKKELFIQITPEWVMLFDDQAHGDTIWERLSGNQGAAQDATAWRNYRQGKLVSLMALAPAKAGRAIGGMSGMMAHGAASKAPNLNAVAAGLGIDPLKGALAANFHLASDDADWNNSTVAEIQKGLDEFTQEGGSVSPTLVGVMSRLTVAGKPDAVDVDLKLDGQLLNDMGQVVREGIGSLFSMGMSSGGQKGAPPQERLNDKPQRYENLGQLVLPPYKDKYQSEPPLFSREPFAVDVKSVQPTKEGNLELWLEGKVGLPDNKEGRFNDIGKVSMQVTSVQDANGRELLRDELCLERNQLMGRSPNHEPEEGANHHQDHGWVWKHVRLVPDVAVEEIHRIRGGVAFSIPSQVRKFVLPLQAGQEVEHAGVRFYLSSIKPDAVSYQLSGATDNLLEIRGLNKDGRVLRQGWSMSSTDGGQSTQNFQGEVKGLELYIAENHFKRKTDFELLDLFKQAKKEKKEKSPPWYAPEKIDAKDWRQYAKLDLNKLEINPKKDWHVWGKDINPVAEASWPPIRMFVTHTPKQWGNNPTAHLYFPQLKELPGVLSGMSYRIDEPAVKDGVQVQYRTANYWYKPSTGEVLVKRTLDDQPIALNSFQLATGLEDDQKLERLKGELTFRLPQKTRSERLALSELWKGKTVEGITVTLTDVKRGMFPGYGLKVEGALEALVNLHGIAGNGERIVASPINFQYGGFWTMTLPFGKGIEEVELVIASAQEVIRYPFDFVPKYP